MTSPRAGLVMETDAKVKYRGIQIGKVESIDYAGDQAKLTLAIDSSELRYIPSNAKVRIAGTTVFGAKSVEFLPPDQPTGGSLRPGAQVQASDVQLEVNTLFQTLTDMLHKVDPVNLNATLIGARRGPARQRRRPRRHAGRAELLSAAAQSEAADAAAGSSRRPRVVGNIYADAAPDLVTVFDNAPTISKTIVDQQDNLNATLLAATGLANNGTATLQPAADDSSPRSSGCGRR